MRGVEEDEAIFWLLDEEEEDVFAEDELVLPASPFLLLLETFFADEEQYGSPTLRFEDDWSRKTFRCRNKSTHSNSFCKNKIEKKGIIRLIIGKNYLV